MGRYIIFFNAANHWNERTPNWHRLTPDPHVNEWIVGELEDGYITERTIDTGVQMVSHHADLESAITALLALTPGGDGGLT